MSGQISRINQRRITVKKTVPFIIILCMLVQIACFTACSKDEEASDPVSDSLKREMKIDDNDFEDPAFDNEIEGAEITTIPRKEDAFIGTWEAPSDKAAYLYGNVNLKINDDHTWSGNITNESFQGKWMAYQSGIVIKDNEGFINWRLYYTSDGTLMFSEVKDPEIALVLKPGARNKN